MKTAWEQQQEVESRAAGPLPDMDEGEFRRWVDLVEERTGMALPPARKSFLVTSVGLRMREIGCATYQEYFHKLTGSKNGLVEWSILVDRLTVHETRFFRHPQSMELVREQVLGKRPARGRANASVHAWSVGCSTGEEAYTLAMVIDRCLRENHVEGYFGITGTDISQPALSVGRSGVYSARRIKDIDPGLVEDYFERLEDGRVRICEPLRRRVCFARMNILDIDHECLGDMDIIYCQNLLIYFDRERREDLVNAMVERLMPGGLLILGSGELVGWSHPRMHKVQSAHTLAYRRSVED